MFTSRQKSQLSVIGSRIIELTRLITPKKYPSIILDGEFYIHGRSFEDILSIVKRADQSSMMIELTFIKRMMSAPLSQSSRERYAGALVELVGVTPLSAAAAVV
jgi:hypothetical protein